MAPCSPVVSDQPAFWHLDAARGPSTPSLDHLVGAGEQGCRHVEAERLRRLKVDHQLERGWLQHRKLRRFGALEYPPGIDARLEIGVGEACPVADQAASEPEPAVEVDCRYAIPGREPDELILPTIEKRICTNRQSHARQSGDVREHCVNLAFIARGQYAQFTPALLRCCLRISSLRFCIRIPR